MSSKNDEQEITECVVSRDSPHLKHRNIGAVWSWGQVASPRHWVVRRLHIKLASQYTFIIQLLLTNTDQREWISLNEIISCWWIQWDKLVLIKHRTDPFADLSVDEDQVIQGQDYLWWSTITTTTKAEPNPPAFPEQPQFIVKIMQYCTGRYINLWHTGVHTWDERTYKFHNQPIQGTGKRIKWLLGPCLWEQRRKRKYQVRQFEFTEIRNHLISVTCSVLYSPPEQAK